MQGVASILTVVLTMIGPPLEGEGPADTRAIAAPHCLVSLIDEAQVASREAGLLTAVNVKEGQPVRTGELLAQVDDRAPQLRRKATALEFQVAKETATNDINVRFSKATADVSQAEYEEALAANQRRPGSVSDAEVRRRKLQADKARLQIEQSNLEFKVEGLTAQVKGASVDIADEEIERRRIVSPFDGVVVQVQKHTGEWVSPGDTVLRIVRMDRLRVEGFLSAQETTPQQVAGRTVTVDVKLTRTQSHKFHGRIDFASPIVEASGEYRFWAELENERVGGHWLLRPGLRGDLTIQPPEPGAAPETPVSAPAGGSAALPLPVGPPPPLQFPPLPRK